MPYNPAGLYSLIASYFARPGQTIRTEQHNPVLEDIGSALSNVLIRDGRAPMTAPLRVVDGSAIAPSIMFSSDPSRGLFKTAGGIGVSVDGIQVADLNPSPSPLPYPVGEVGVVNVAYPVGDVRRYGLFPDAELITGVYTTSGSPTLSGSVGTFAKAQVGMHVWGPNVPTGGSATIIAKAGDNSTITLDSNATVTAAGTAKIIVGSAGITLDSTLYANLATNGLNPNITLYFPPGFYADGWNMGAEYTGTTAAPWKAHFDNAIFCGIFHIIEGCSYIRCTGTIGTYDRFGVTAEGSDQIWVENVIGLHDVNMNTNSVGVAGNRGFHIVACKSLIFDTFVLNDCEPTTNDGTQQLGSLSGFAFEQGRNAYTIRGRKIWCKNSATHGVVMSGGAFYIDHVQVDGYGKSPVDFLSAGGIGEIVQTDCEVATGFATRRATGYIGRLEVRQSNASPSDTGQRALLLSETGDVTITDETQKSFSFGSIYAEVGSALASCGGNITIGCPQGTTSNTDVRANYDIGLMEVVLKNGWSLDNATDSLVMFNAPAAGGVESYKIDKLRIISPQGYNAIGLTGVASDDRQLVLGEVQFLKYDGTTSLINMIGNSSGNTRVKIGSINFAAGSTAYTSRSILTFDTLKQLTINGIAATASAAVDNSLLNVKNSFDVDVSHIRARNYNGVSSGCIALTANTYLRLTGVDVVGTTATNSWGIFLAQSAHAYYSLNDVYVSSYAVGTRKGGTPTFTNLAVTNSAAISCTSASNLATGDATSKVNQSLVTA